MNYQDSFNLVLGVAAFFGGWILNSVRDSVKSLHESDTLLSDRVQANEVLVAGQYVRREELDKAITALFAKLDRIENKLDSKLDKHSNL